MPFGDAQALVRIGSAGGLRGAAPYAAVVGRIQIVLSPAVVRQIGDAVREIVSKLALRVRVKGGGGSV